MAIDVEREADTGRFGTPLTEPQFGKLVDEVLGLTEPRSGRSIGRIIAEWQREREHQAVTEGPAIGIRPMRAALGLPEKVHGWNRIIR